jgi:hypothetical protein
VHNFLSPKSFINKTVQPCEIGIPDAKHSSGQVFR